LVEQTGVIIVHRHILESLF